MAKMTNTFNQGMDQDSSKNKYDDKHYYDARNVRVFSQDGLSGGALEDIQGTLERIDLGSSLHRVVGSCVLRDDLILFIGNSFNGNPSYIIRVPIEEIEDLTGSNVYTVDFVNYHTTPGDGYNLIYQGDAELGFTISHPIKAIPRYENEFVQKIYWIDSYHNLRWINTVYDADTNDLINLPLDHLEVIGNFHMTAPNIKEVISGELKTGKIQYAYQLYMLNGSETVYSPATPLFHVTQAIDTDSNSLNYFGSNIDEDTGKGFQGQIGIYSNQYYTRCRIIAIQYFTYSDEPEIRIISETDITSGFGADYVNFRDTGQTLGNLTLEQLRILSTSIFSAGDVETKDNILFASDIMEDAFDTDYDARAYRFSGNSTNYGNHNYRGSSRRQAWLYDDGGAHTVIYGDTKVYSGGGTWVDVPEDHDCINYYNDAILENNPVQGGPSYPWSHKYRYQSDGVTCGGEGPNVSYVFTTESMEISHDFTTGVYPNAYQIYSNLAGFGNNFSYEGQESPYQSANYAGYMRDEIYRFGIVFFDNRGRESFVKWIGDVRFPSHSFPSYGSWVMYTTYTNGTVITANIPGIEFTINNMPSDAISYQIVRVKRENTDKSILTQGIVNQPDDGTSANTVCFDRWRNTGNNTHKIFQLHSPEIAFNKNLAHRVGSDYIRVVGNGQPFIGVRTYSPTGITPSPKPYDVMDLTRYTQFNVFTPLTEVQGTNVVEMEDGKIVTQQEVQVNVGSAAYIVQSGDSLDTALRATKGINFVFQTPDPSGFLPENNPYTDYCLVNYCRNIFESQYGGITYEARKSSEYIVAGKIDNGVVFGGDTYVGMYDCHYSAHLQGWGVHTPGGLRTDAVYFPCETVFNLPLRTDNCYSRAFQETDAGLIHETAGVWDDGAIRFYFEETDLHIYNPVFSRPNDTRLFVDAPFDWKELTTFDSRIIASQTKTNGEQSDNWLKFPSNQFIDVDPQYGPIKAIKTFNNKLLFFQDSAFGVVSVNERALIETGNVSQLSLGVAGLLDRYDYGKTGIGCYHWRHLTLTPQALYWLDLKGKAMYKYGKGPEEVSLMKGMDTWFRDNIPDEDIGNKIIHSQIGAGLHMWQDPEFKEVYLTEGGLIGGFTLMYNEVTDGFTCFTNHQPAIVMNYLDKTLSTRNSSGAGINIHRHNDFNSNRGFIFDAYHDISITLLVNPHPDSIAIFNNFEWLTEATYYGIDRPETWQSIEMWNDYQNTGVIPLIVEDNVKRRMRKWRFTIPRSIFLRNGVSPQPDGQRYARMRDSHMFSKFSYRGDVGKALVMHDIITSHNISNS